MRHRLFERFLMLVGIAGLMAPLSCTGAADWLAAQIADALRAAPPSITHMAQIYAWHPYGQLGPGPRRPWPVYLRRQWQRLAALRQAPAARP